MRTLLLTITLACPAFAADPPKDTPAAAQSRKKLAARVTVDFKDVTLDAALEDLSLKLEDQKLGPITRFFPVAALKTSKVTFAGTDMPVVEVLDAILKPLELGYTVYSKDGDRQDGWFLFTKGTHRGYPPGVTGPEVVAVKPTDKKPDPAKPAEPVAADGDEANAQSRIVEAKKLIADDKAADAVKLLKYVVRYYPNTKGAVEAKELLEKMK